MTCGFRPKLAERKKIELRLYYWDWNKPVDWEGQIKVTGHDKRKNGADWVKVVQCYHEGILSTTMVSCNGDNDYSTENITPIYTKISLGCTITKADTQIHNKTTCVAMPSLMATHWVGQNSGPIFLPFVDQNKPN